MVKIIIVKKNGDVKCSNVKDLSLDNLHKKCLLTTNKNFDVRHVWHYDDSYISLYSKNKGKAGTENKFELPPPLDNELYFGTVGFFKHRSEELNIDEIENFEMEDFKKMIDHLFGGFENLDDTSEGTSEEEVIPEEFKTKDGYSKEDGFIVSSDEDLEFEDLENGDSDYYEEEYVENSEDEDEDEEEEEGGEEEESEKEKEDTDVGEDSEEEESEEEEQESDDEDYSSQEEYLSEEEYETEPEDSGDEN